MANKSLQLHGLQSQKDDPHADHSPLSNLTTLRGKEPCSRSKPAALQSCPSSSILLSTTSAEGEAPLNTMSFRCLQIVHATRVTTVQISFLSCLCGVRAVHHCTKVASAVGIQEGLPHALVIQDQTCLANTHPNSKWSMVSWAWSQKGHAEG